jgi:hypothetical protein
VVLALVGPYREEQVVRAPELLEKPGQVPVGPAPIAQAVGEMEQPHAFLTTPEARR